MNTTRIFYIFTNNNLNFGRLISGSKSLYREKYPKNEVYFNCNVFTEEDGKVWYGDLDVTHDKPALERVCKELKQNLYILREMDGRFCNEELDKEEIKKRAVRVIYFE